MHQHTAVHTDVREACKPTTAASGYTPPSTPTQHMCLLPAPTQTCSANELSTEYHTHMHMQTHTYTSLPWGENSNHTDMKYSIINKTSRYNINHSNKNKTLNRAHFTLSSNPNLPLLRRTKVTHSSLQSQSMQKSYISNIKIQIHKITIETK